MLNARFHQETTLHALHLRMRCTDSALRVHLHNFAQHRHSDRSSVFRISIVCRRISSGCIIRIVQIYQMARIHTQTQQDNRKNLGMQFRRVPYSSNSYSRRAVLQPNRAPNFNLATHYCPCCNLGNMRRIHACSKESTSAETSCSIVLLAFSQAIKASHLGNASPHISYTSLYYTHVQETLHGAAERNAPSTEMPESRNYFQ